MGRSEKEKNQTAINREEIGDPRIRHGSQTAWSLAVCWPQLGSNFFAAEISLSLIKIPITSESVKMESTE